MVLNGEKVKGDEGGEFTGFIYGREGRCGY